MLRPSTIKLLLLLLGVLGCHSSKSQQQATATKMPAIVQPPVNGDICPDCAKVRAKIVAVEPASAGVCAEGPCMAMVQVLEVLGEGRSFGAQLSTETPVQMRFTMGLAARVAKGYDKALPGLVAGSEFIALVQAYEVANSNKPSIVVSVYERK